MKEKYREDEKVYIPMSFEEIKNLPKEAKEKMREIFRKGFNIKDDFIFSEKALEKYLEIHYYNMHLENPNPDEYARFILGDNVYSWVNQICLKNGYVKDYKITDKGIQFLGFIENKRLSKRQYWFNVILTIATVIMAIFTVVTVFKK